MDIFYTYAYNCMDFFVAVMKSAVNCLALFLLSWLFAFLFLRKSGNKWAVSTSFFFSISVFVYTYGIGISWLMRDGLAPGFVESHGQTAMSRFLPLLTMNVVSTLPTTTLSVICYLKGLRK